MTDREWSVSENRQIETLDFERNDRLAELESVTVSLDTCLSEAAEVRRNMRRNKVSTSKGSDAKTDWFPEYEESARSNRALLVKELEDVVHLFLKPLREHLVCFIEND